MATESTTLGAAWKTTLTEAGKLLASVGAEVAADVAQGYLDGARRRAVTRGDAALGPTRAASMIAGVVEQRAGTHAGEAFRRIATGVRNDLAGVRRLPSKPGV